MKTVPCVWVVEENAGLRWMPVTGYPLRWMARNEVLSVAPRFKGRSKFRIRKYIRSGE